MGLRFTAPMKWTRTEMQYTYAFMQASTYGRESMRRENGRSGRGCAGADGKRLLALELDNFPLCSRSEASVVALAGLYGFDNMGKGNSVYVRTEAHGALRRQKS